MARWLRAIPGVCPPASTFRKWGPSWHVAWACGPRNLMGGVGLGWIGCHLVEKRLKDQDMAQSETETRALKSKMVTSEETHHQSIPIETDTNGTYAVPGHLRSCGWGQDWLLLLKMVGESSEMTTGSYGTKQLDGEEAHCQFERRRTGV